MRPAGHGDASYEETHKDRANVASAVQTQLASLAKEAVGVDS